MNHRPGPGVCAITTPRPAGRRHRSVARDGLIGLAAMLVLFCASDGVRQGASTAPRAALVADNEGSLQELVMHFDPGIEGDAAPTYRDLLRALAPTVRIRVAVAERAHFRRFVELLHRWGIPNTERFRRVVTGRTITTWSRDRYSLLRQGDRRIMLVPPRPVDGHAARQNDWLVPFAVARAAGPDVTVRRADLIFEGGDLTATRRHVFATPLLLARNVGGTLGDPARLVRWLRKNTGREPVLLGRDPSEVPGHHIGMFVTPLVDRTVLVGDVEAGLRLLPPGIRLSLPVDRSPETLRKFQSIAARLIDKGFSVRPVPLVPLSDGLTYVTYNNALLERRSDGRLHAYVPQFGIPALDRAGLAAYATQGFVTHPIDVSRIYRHNGTVRCLVNVLRRGGR